MKRTRGRECASDLVFDRWAAGELSRGEIAAIEAHLARCARCRARRASIDETRVGFSDTLPIEIAERVAAHASDAPPVAPIPLASRSSRRRLVPMVAAAVALAAGVVLFVRARSTPTLEGVGSTAGTYTGEPSTTRVKGGAHVVFHVEHAGVVRLGVEGDRLVPGDAIEFSYTTPAAGYLAIVSVDVAGHPSTYYDDAGHAARVEPGSNRTLGESTVLDASLGHETVYALFCDRPVLLAPALAALGADPGGAPSVPGCAVDRHSFTKVAP